MAFKYFKDEDGAGIIGFGTTIEKAFEEAAKAMFSLVTDLKKTKPLPEKIELECSAESTEELLIEWLNEVLRESAVHGIIFSKIKIESMKNLRIKGWAKGMKYEKEIRLEPTYEKVLVGKKNRHFFAQCIIKQGG
jgi:SHS2 domain-containing protein